MLGIEAAGRDDPVVHLPEHVRVLQRAEAAAGVLVADIALRRHRDQLVGVAVRILVGHVLGPEQSGRDLGSGPDVVKLQPIVRRRVGLFGRVGRQHALADAGVGVVLAGAKAMDRVVDHRLDPGLDQRRDHPHVESGLRREQDSRRLDAERLLDDAPVPLDLLDDVAVGGQRHQRVVEAERGEVDAGIAESGGVACDGAERPVPAGEASAAQAVAGAAVELFDQRSAPACRQTRVRQPGVRVLAHRRRDEVGVVAAARAEDPVLLAVPGIRIGGVVIRLVHVLVDAEVDLDLGAGGDTGPGGGAGRGVQHHRAELLDPVAAVGPADVGLAAALHLNRDLPRPGQAGRHVDNVLGRRFHGGGGADGVAIDQMPSPVGMDDDLWERDFAVGAQGDREFGILSRGLADEAGGRVDAKKPRENGHCRTPERLETKAIDRNGPSAGAETAHASPDRAIFFLKIGRPRALLSRHARQPLRHRPTNEPKPTEKGRNPANRRAGAGASGRANHGFPCVKNYILYSL